MCIRDSSGSRCPSCATPMCRCNVISFWFDALVFRRYFALRCPTKSVLYRTVPQVCPTRVSYKNVPQECSARVSHKSVLQECPTRVSYKSAPQECPKKDLASVCSAVACRKCLCTQKSLWEFCVDYAPPSLNRERLAYVTRSGSWAPSCFSLCYGVMPPYIGAGRPSNMILPVCLRVYYIP